MLSHITGVILAGGRSSRMGGHDKGLLQLGNQPLYQHVLSRLHGQVGTILISANRHLVEYRQSGYPVITDITPDFAGPLAGMLAGLTAAQTEWVFFAPCDVPAFPLNTVERLWLQRRSSLAIYASDGERVHPTLALLHTSLVTSLTQYLEQGERRLMGYLQGVRSHAVLFTDELPAFRNFNTPDDLRNGTEDSR